jgi:chromosome segregation ATPase
MKRSPLCRKHFEEQKNGNSAVQHCGELLEAVIAADRVYAEHEKRLHAVTEELNRLQVERAELDASVKDIREQLNGFQTDLVRREAAARERLRAVEEQVTVREAMLADANESLARLAAFGGDVDEVANEYGRAFTDPQHAMYLYRGTKKFEQWADTLYHRIAIAQA